jgi:hypothetical protein
MTAHTDVCWKNVLENVHLRDSEGDGKTNLALVLRKRGNWWKERCQSHLLLLTFYSAANHFRQGIRCAKFSSSYIANLINTGISWVKFAKPRTIT